VALEAAKRFPAALTFGMLALQVGTSRRVHACLRDRDPVQGAVELAVAGAVEAVTLPLARGGEQGCGAGVFRELRIASEALDARDLAHEIGGGQGAAADDVEQLLGLVGEQRLELALELVDAAGQLAASLDEL